MYKKVFISDKIAKNAKPNFGVSLKAGVKAEPLRGPHQSREIDLMINHGKPCAIMYKQNLEIPEYKRYYRDEIGGYLYYKKDSPHLLSMLIRCMSMWERNLISWNTYTIRLGRLLGYSKESIIYFITVPPVI